MGALFFKRVMVNNKPIAYLAYSKLKAILNDRIETFR